MTARARILLLTDAGQPALPASARAELLRLLEPFGYACPTFLDGGEEFRLAKQRCQWGGAAYARWPLYVGHEKLGTEPRYHAVAFYGLSRQVRAVGDGWCDGYRLGPVNLLCAAAVMRQERTAFVFDEGDGLLTRVQVVAPDAPEWLPGHLMVYQGAILQRGRQAKEVTMGFVIRAAAEEPPEAATDAAEEQP